MLNKQVHSKGQIHLSGWGGGMVIITGEGNVPKKGQVIV